MKLLAIDSSGLTATVACMDGETLMGEYTIQYKKTHSQTLLPMIDEVVKMIEWDLKEMDAIAVAAGPGSFTGLRIGAATAKGLGFALDVPVVPVPTLEGLAYNLYGTGAVVCPMMDARRNQVYAGIYEFAAEAAGSVSLHEAAGQGNAAEVHEAAEPAQAVSLHEDIQPPESFCLHELWKGRAAAIEEVIGAVNAIGRSVTFLGDGVSVQKNYILANCHVPYAFTPPHMSRQRAGAVAAIAMRYLKEGKAVPAAEFKPSYFRLSQAERERMERERTGQE